MSASTDALCRLSDAISPPAEKKLTEAEAVARLCRLMAKVRDRLDGPADCFCAGTYRDPTGYRNDGTAIEFIERATLAALELPK
jgi:hypothetical protein